MTSINEDAIKDCAGVLFRAPGPLYLLVRRSDTGEWAQPGGHLEAGETPEQAAVRECSEEIGDCPDGLRWRVRRTPIAAGGEFTCYLQDVPAPFKPILNDEHTAWTWASPGALPDGMLPAVAETISLVTGNELDIAKRVAACALLSPQKYESVWLFDVRVTGTGLSYRESLDEYVWRPPERFLSDEFVERCNGLPLIFLHPGENLLNTEEWRDRVSGIVILPYIKGEEVWGIAKVYDADAAALMQSSHASTSPAVVFRDAGSTETILVDGKTVLVEGDPSLLDHLAICEVGVWDKGGEPNGVNNGDPKVENEDKVPAWADAITKGFADMSERLDSACSRLDSIENKGGNTMPAVPPKAGDANPPAGDPPAPAAPTAPTPRADAETDEERAAREEKERADAAAAEEAAKADAARADAARENADLKKQLVALQSQVSGLVKPLSATDRDALALAQSRADSVAQMFGDSVTAPLNGENPVAYRKRLAMKFQKHSLEMKDVKLDSLDGAAFDLVENKIYADAQGAALSPAALPAGRLIPIVRKDSAGREITTYAGDMDGWLSTFKAPGAVVKFNRQNKGA